MLPQEPVKYPPAVSSCRSVMVRSHSAAFRQCCDSGHPTSPALCSRPRSDTRQAYAQPPRRKTCRQPCPSRLARRGPCHLSHLESLARLVLHWRSNCEGVMAGSKPIEQSDDSRAALCESCASCRQQRDTNCHLRLSFIHMGHGPGLRPAKAENTCKVQTAWSCLTRSLEQSSSQQFRLPIHLLVLSQAVTGKHG